MSDLTLTHSIIPRNVNKSNIPPLIPASTNFTTNYSNFLKTEEVVVSEQLTDGVAILSGGTLTNLVNGPDPQDAVNKAYISGTSFPGGSINNVQFNDGGLFAGTNSFTWSSPTLTVSGKIEDSTGAFLSGGFASGLLAPINDQDIATKAYVDSFSNITYPSTISSNTSTTYTAEQMFNGAIRRDVETNVFNLTVNDTTATAVEIINYGNLGVGSTFNFILSNDVTDPAALFNTGDQFKINVLPGTGITFDIPNNPVLNRRYIMNCIGIVDNIGSGTEAIRFIVRSLTTPNLDPSIFFIDPNITSDSSFTKPYVYSSQTTLPLKIQKNILFPTSDTINTSVNYTYTVSDMKNSIIIRDPSGASADDLFDSTTSFQLGSTIFVIQNISAFSITLSLGASWDGPSSTIIGPGLTAYLAIEQNVGSSSDTMNMKVLGIFKHSNV